MLGHLVVWTLPFGKGPWRPLHWRDTAPPSGREMPLSVKAISYRWTLRRQGLGHWRCSTSSAEVPSQGSTYWQHGDVAHLVRYDQPAAISIGWVEDVPITEHDDPRFEAVTW